MRYFIFINLRQTAIFNITIAKPKITVNITQNDLTVYNVNSFHQIVRATEQFKTCSVRCGVSKHVKGSTIPGEEVRWYTERDVENETRTKVQLIQIYPE